MPVIHRLIVTALMLLCGSSPAVAIEHTTIKSHASGTFSTGWTHLVDTSQGVLYYNSATGAAAVGRFNELGSFSTLKTMELSKGWTSIVSLPDGILFYNSQTGAGLIGRLDATGTLSSVKQLDLSKGWTTIVHTPGGIAYYNAKTGAGALGRIHY